MNNGGGMQVLLADKSLFLPVCYMNRTYEGVCVLLLLLLLYNMSLSCVHIHTAAFLSHCHLWRDSLVHLCAYDGHIESCCGERMCETGLMRTMVLRWHSQTYTYCWLLFLRCTLLCVRIWFICSETAAATLIQRKVQQQRQQQQPRHKKNSNVAKEKNNENKIPYRVGRGMYLNVMSMQIKYSRIKVLIRLWPKL